MGGDLRGKWGLGIKYVPVIYKDVGFYLQCGKGVEGLKCLKKYGNQMSNKLGYVSERPLDPQLLKKTSVVTR